MKQINFGQLAQRAKARLEACGGYTPDERRALFLAEGQTVTEWAATHGYPRNKVYQVLGGQLRAKWGEAHRIAVDLGLKAKPNKSKVVA